MVPAVACLIAAIDVVGVRALDPRRARRCSRVFRACGTFEGVVPRGSATALLNSASPRRDRVHLRRERLPLAILALRSTSRGDCPRLLAPCDPCPLRRCAFSQASAFSLPGLSASTSLNFPERALRVRLIGRRDQAALVEQHLADASNASTCWPRCLFAWRVPRVLLTTTCGPALGQRRPAGPRRTAPPMIQVEAVLRIEKPRVNRARARPSATRREYLAALDDTA